MGIDFKGKKCVVCNAYLFSDDDVVVCPTCGAPHHRECYNGLGHCGLEELHGTENEYKDIKIEENEQTDQNEQTEENVCSLCKRPLLDDADFCPFCGTPKHNSASFSGAQNLFKVDINQEIEDGVTLKEVLPIVAVNQLRYFPSFIKKGKISWNWAAFLIPHAWFGFRKMYSLSWAFSIGFVISSLLSMPFNMALMALPGFNDISGSAALGRFAVENVHLIDNIALVLSAVGFFLRIALMVIGGVLGDKIYKKHIVKTAKEIRKNDNKETALRKKGGISLFVPLLAIGAVVYLPELIFVFLK